MKTQQPSYWCIENIGDVDPVEHGGAFVLVDRTGVYNPVLLILEGDCANGHSLHDIELDSLIRIKDEDDRLDSLSDNRFNPDVPAWFGDKKSLQDLANFSGHSYDSLLNSFLSSCPVERAFPYMSAFLFYGSENLGGNPRKITNEKAEALCEAMLSQIEQTKTWHIGYGING